MFSINPKQKGKTVKGLPIPGEHKKAARHTGKAHARGFVGKQAGPGSSPKLAQEGPSDEPDLTGSGAGESGVNGGEDSVDLDPDTSGGAGVQASPGYEDETSDDPDDDCGCGDATCPGCIVGAMKSASGRQAYINQVKKSK